MPDLYKAEFSISPAVLEHSEGFFKTHIILCSISFTRNKTFFFFFGNQQKNVAWFHPKKQRKQVFGEKMVDFSCIWPRGLFCGRLYGFCVQKTLNRISLVEINSERVKAFCQADSLWAEREHRKPHPQDNSVTPSSEANENKVVSKGSLSLQCLSFSSCPTFSLENFIVFRLTLLHVRLILPYPWGFPKLQKGVMEKYCNFFFFSFTKHWSLKNSFFFFFFSPTSSVKVRSELLISVLWQMTIVTVKATFPSQGNHWSRTPWQ